KFEGEQWDYRAAVQYRWTDDLMTYAQVSTGFKGGGVNPRPFALDQALTFEPETLTAYEVGVKADVLDRRLRLNGSVFLNKYEDVVRTAGGGRPPTPPLPCARPTTAGAAEVRGLEREADLRIVAALSIDAPASYLHFEYTKINAPTSGTTTAMTSPFAPKYKY